MDALMLKNVSKAINENFQLKDISFTLPEGTIYGNLLVKTAQANQPLSTALWIW